jgi:hypothetical protein
MNIILKNTMHNKYHMLVNVNKNPFLGRHANRRGWTITKKDYLALAKNLCGDKKCGCALTVGDDWFSIEKITEDEFIIYFNGKLKLYLQEHLLRLEEAKQ